MIKADTDYGNFMPIEKDRKRRSVARELFYLLRVFFHLFLCNFDVYICRNEVACKNKAVCLTSILYHITNKATSSNTDTIDKTNYIN